DGGRLGGIGDDLQAGGGDARRIGEREVALVAEGLGGLDLELTGPRIAVIEQRARFQILRDIVRHTIPPRTAYGRSQSITVFARPRPAIAWRAASPAGRSSAPSGAS